MEAMIEIDVIRQYWEIVRQASSGLKRLFTLRVDRIGALENKH